MILIDSHGPLITASDYWRSDAAKAGKILISPNAGVIRVLMPPARYDMLGDLRSASHAVVTVGWWSMTAARKFGLESTPIREGGEAVEILWEDGTDSPHAWHVTPESCLLVPGDPSPGQWSIACWIERRGEPHRALERPAFWRRGKVPCLQPFSPA